LPLTPAGCCRTRGAACACPPQAAGWGAGAGCCHWLRLGCGCMRADCMLPDCPASALLCACACCCCCCSCCALVNCVLPCEDPPSQPWLPCPAAPGCCRWRLRARTRIAPARARRMPLGCLPAPAPLLASPCHRARQLRWHQLPPWHALCARASVRAGSRLGAPVVTTLALGVQRSLASLVLGDLRRERRPPQPRPSQKMAGRPPAQPEATPTFMVACFLHLQT